MQRLVAVPVVLDRRDQLDEREAGCVELRRGLVSATKPWSSMPRAAATAPVRLADDDVAAGRTAGVSAASVPPRSSRRRSRRGRARRPQAPARAGTRRVGLDDLDEVPSRCRRVDARRLRELGRALDAEDVQPNVEASRASGRLAARSRDALSARAEALPSARIFSALGRLELRGGASVYPEPFRH